MSMANAFDIALVALLLAMAVWVVVTRAAFTAIVVFVAYGLMVAIAWVRLYAVDIALTEAAIGSGLTGMLLLGAAARLRGTTPTGRCGTLLLIVAAVFCAVISLGFAAVILTPPDVIVTLAPAAMEHLPPSGLGNPVAGVLFVYRAFDTMLEKVVLLLALLGIWSLTPDRLWGGVPGPQAAARPDGLLAFLGAAIAAFGNSGGCVYDLDRRRPSGRRLSGRHGSGRHVDPGRHRRSAKSAFDRPTLSQVIGGGGSGDLPRHRTGGLRAGGWISQLSGGLRQAVDHCGRSRADPFDRRNARPVGVGYAATDAAPMNAATLFGICGAALAGLGLFGLITNPEPLRKILAFNLLGTGTFLIFGVVARRGAAAGLGGDPVPQALVITGIVVAFSATAMAVVLVLRLFEESGQATLSPDDADNGKAEHDS